MSCFHVVIDDRETNSGTAEALQRLDDIDLVVDRLSVGDYQWDDGLLFERKTLVDLAVSLKDGRLFRQASRLAAAPRRSVLLLEGTARDLAASHMRREALQGALVTITVLLGIPLLRAKDPEESARLMHYTALQVRALGHAATRGDAYPRPHPSKRPKGKHKAQLYLLQGLPGIGPTRARRLLERFGSVEAAFTATTAELTSVPGLGRATAEAIRWAVSEQAQPYALFDDDPVL